jgi:glycerol kinase
MILAIDQGTTGTTCIVFDEEGRPRGRSYSEFEQHFPKPGWVEHDAGEIWEVTRKVAIGALTDAGVQGSDLHGIGITNQRETGVTPSTALSSGRTAGRRPAAISCANRATSS